MISHPFSLVVDLRPTIPWSIYSAPVSRYDDGRPVEHRFAVRWDEDNDERVLKVALALYYRSPCEFRFIHAYAEQKAALTVYQLGFRKDVEREILGALDNFIVVEDSWSVDVEENFLPPPTSTSLELAAMHLCAAPDTAATDKAFKALAPVNSEIALSTILLHVKPKPGIDAQLAALHTLYELGSFGARCKRVPQ